MSRAVALETRRGWRIAKEKAAHKIDVVVALAMAALGAVQQGQGSAKIELTPTPYPRVVTVERGRLVAGGLSPYRVRSGFLGMALTYVRQRTAAVRQQISRPRWRGF
jgi:hypothetical protein